MPGPRISITLSAGTADFVLAMEKAKVKVKDFGDSASGAMHGTVSSTQAASGALRLLEGNFTNNIRAVEKFIATTLHLGPALQAAFGFVGAAATAGIIAKMGEEAYTFFRDIVDGEAKASGAFRSFNTTLRLTNDELRVANDRIENQIAKLEGHRQNTLKLSLDEARASADKLADSLDNDLKKLSAILKEQSTGFLRHFIGEAPTNVREKLFGNSGIEGVETKTGDITQGANQQLDSIAARFAAASEKDKPAIAAEANKVRENTRKQLDALYGPIIEESDKALADFKNKQQLHNNASKLIIDANRAEAAAIASGKDLPAAKAGVQIPEDNSRNILSQQTASNALRQTRDHYLNQFANETLTKRLGDDEARRDNAKLDKPFQDRVEKLKAEIAGLQQQFAAIGQDENAQVMAKAFAEAATHIADINKGLKEAGGHSLPADKADQILGLTETKVRTEASLEFQKSVNAETDAINIRIQAQKALTSAVGEGYEAAKRANVETEVAQKLGKNYNPTFIRDNQADVDKLRASGGKEYDARFGLQQKQTVDSLERQTALEERLVEVRSRGLAVVELVTLNYRAKELRDAGKNAEADALIRNSIAARKDLNAQTVADLNREIKAAEDLAAAEMRGSEAARQQALDNKYAAMAMHNAGEDAIRLEREKDDIAHRYTVTADALAASRAYNKQIGDLREQLAVVRQLEAQQGETRDLEIDRTRLEKQLSEVLVQQALSTGKLKDGLKAFFTEAKAEAAKPGQILYDSLNRAVDGFSESLTRALTGQKGEWGKLLKDLGTQALQSQIKRALQQGIGAVGDKLGLTLTGPPDGSQKKPFYVIPVSGASSLVPGIGGSANDPSNISNLIIKNFADSIIPGRNSSSGIHGMSSMGGRDGQSDQSAFWVQMAQGNTAQQAAAQKPGFWGPFLGSLAGSLLGAAAGGIGGSGSGGGESVTSNISFGGARADGGTVSSGMAYLVGERGPELYMPKTSGSITPNGRFGGDTHYHDYKIDARGATDPNLTALRVGQAIKAAHADAIKHSVLTVHELSFRKPS